MDRIKLHILFSILIFLILLTGCEKNLTGIKYTPEYKIACVPRGIGDLYLFDTERINHQLLVTGVVYQINWSPTEAKLVYLIQPDPPEYHTNLYGYNLLNNQKKLLADEEGYKIDPAFSPDGRSILYFNRIYSTSEIKLTLMNENGANKKVLYTLSFGDPPLEYHWSGIPGYLVFAQYDPTYMQEKLSLFDINTQSMQFIIGLEYSNSHVKTIDGKNFFYSFSDQANNICGINKVNIDEQKEVRILTMSRPDWINTFSLHPNGSKIVLSVSSIRQNAWVRDLYQVNTDGSNLEQLTESTGVDDLYDDPAYLPDGSQIIFIHATISAREMWGLNLADGKITKITEGDPFTGGSYLFAISPYKL